MNLSTLSSADVVALAIAASFAAGLNVSATVATIGLLARYGVLSLPPGPDLVANPWVIGAALVLFVVEFVMDKIPAVDLVWNALQTFVRVPAGALVAYGASAELPLDHQLLVALLGAVVALGSHAGKAALHASVNLSPEPFSNALVSLAEDATAISVTWFATRHPFLAASIAFFWLVVVAIFIRWVWQALFALFRNARQG